ncbi:MAG TPA: hypothetical protein VER03_22470 [Bryobacteraceae bacterium]|nr:hypothetical protein [Bryobacteraceae bacterium]
MTDAGFEGPARFTIERSFAGIEPGTSSINVDPASRTSCSVEFKMGQRYLVYAYRLKNGAVFTTQCAGSKLIAQADDGLRFLEAWARGLSITTIQGNVRPAFGYESNELYGRQLARLAGSTVRAIGAGGLNYTGRVGGSGSYNIVGVRPGAYTMSFSQADFRPTECDYQVEVPLGGCGVASAFMNPDGRVLGRLQSSDGETPPPVVIQLISYAMGKCRLTMRWRQPARHTERSSGRREDPRRSFTSGVRRGVTCL